MHLRRTAQRNKDGSKRTYVQLVQSYRDTNGRPRNRIIGHLGAIEENLFENLKRALNASRKKRLVVEKSTGEKDAQRPDQATVVRFDSSLLFLPAAVVAKLFKECGLEKSLNELTEPPERYGCAISTVLSALVAHRCIDPGSKLGFQRWLQRVAVEECFGVPAERLNNTRVHRAMATLSKIDRAVQNRITSKICKAGRPRILYLDLTDTWFEAGGGSLARRAQTKAGHRNKLKINIALLVNEQGVPLQWRLLRGALNESTVLPDWLTEANRWNEWANAVMVFDRGLPTVDNFHRLVGKEGHLFLTSVRSNTISTYVPPSVLNAQHFDQVQALKDDATAEEVLRICEALSLTQRDRCTYLRDLGLLEPPATRGKSKSPPKMRMYLYFNPDMQRTMRRKRQERLRKAEFFVEELNQALKKVRRSREFGVTKRKVDRQLEKLNLCEIYTAIVESVEVSGKTKQLQSFQIGLQLNESKLKAIRRYDGFCLLVGHPKLDMSAEEAVSAYREKNAVEVDFHIIKSVLDIRPTFHRTDQKISAHVSICAHGLLIERLIEQRLEKNKPNSKKEQKSWPRTADGLLSEFCQVRLARLKIGDSATTIRSDVDDRMRKLLRALNCHDLLERFEPYVVVPIGSGPA